MDNFMDQLAQKYNAGEMIRANGEAEARQMQNLEEQVEAYEAVLQEMRKLNYKNTELTEKMYALVDEGIDKVHNLQLVAGTGEVAPSVINNEMANVVNEVQLYAEAVQKSSDDMRSTMALVSAKNEEVSSKVDSLSAQNEEVSFKVDSLSAKNEEVSFKVDSLSAKNDEVSSKMDSLSAKNDEVKASMAQLMEETSTIKESIHKMLSEKAENPAPVVMEAVTPNISVTESEEMKAAMAEIKDAGSATRSSMETLSATSNEIKIGIVNLKNASDETRNTLQNSFDAAIYGLKQDNREIVEFIQRINAQMNAKDGDAEAKRKEEESKEREEETRRILEEHFKNTEDFMHKESVKVYRNVQAVINENGEKNFDGLEMQLKRVGSKATSAKVWAILATIMATAGLVIQILQILHII